MLQWTVSSQYTVHLKFTHCHVSNICLLKKDNNGSCFIINGIQNIAYMVLILLLQSFRITFFKKAIIKMQRFGELPKKIWYLKWTREPHEKLISFKLFLIIICRPKPRMIAFQRLVSVRAGMCEHHAASTTSPTVKRCSCERPVRGRTPAVTCSKT